MGGKRLKRLFLTGERHDWSQAFGAVSILELPAPATGEAIPTLRAFIGDAADGGLAIEQGAPTLGTGQSRRRRIGAGRNQGGGHDARIIDEVERSTQERN
jgi:hypothetical protein